MKIPFFAHIFLNKYASVINQGKIMKLSGLIFHVILKGSMSQILYLSPSFYFML